MMDSEPTTYLTDISIDPPVPQDGTDGEGMPSQGSPVQMLIDGEEPNPVTLVALVEVLGLYSKGLQREADASNDTNVHIINDSSLLEDLARAIIKAGDADEVLRVFITLNAQMTARIRKALLCTSTHILRSIQLSKHANRWQLVAPAISDLIFRTHDDRGL